MLVIYGGKLLQRVQFLNYPNACLVCHDLNYQSGDCHVEEARDQRAKELAEEDDSKSCESWSKAEDG